MNASQFCDLTCALSDGNRLAVGLDYDSDGFFENQVKKIKVYELSFQQPTPEWKLIGNIPHTNQRGLLTKFADFYHDAVLSGNGQVLAMGASKVSESYKSLYSTKIITTYKWNSTDEWDSTEGYWAVMDDKGGLLYKTQESPCTPGLQKCIAFSDDGTVLAVSSKLGVEVYSWKANKSAWIPRDIAYDFNKLVASYDG
jgi:hypothetical protein